jgi:hypothetical protein
MSDFFLPQMGDVLTEGVSFDTSLVRGMGDGRFGDPHSLRMLAWAIRAAAARHHFQTLDFLAHGFVEDSVNQED